MKHQALYSLTKKDTFFSILFGFIFWAAGAAISYICSLYEIQNNFSGFLVYATIGLSSGYLTIWTFQFIAKISFDNLLQALALGGMTATFFDGICLNWFSHLYSSNGIHGAAFGGAFVLWGIFSLYFAYFTLLLLQKKKETL